MTRSNTLARVFGLDATATQYLLSLFAARPAAADAVTADGAVAPEPRGSTRG